MPEGTREALVTEAARLLDSGGPTAVTLRAVGRAAGVSHNAPYRHFANKEALLAAVAIRELARQGGGRAVKAMLDPLEHLKARMVGYLRWAERHPERFRLAYGRWSHTNDALNASASLARASLVEAVVAAQEGGQAPAGDPERLAALILALAHGAADLTLSGHLARHGKGRASPEDLLDDLFALFEASASSPPASSP
jgi:AcrR family transcriptional regulator